MTYDIEQIRKDFTILDRQVRGKALVYLDNAATTQKPRQVIDALVHYYEHYNANIHRGLHTLAEEATLAYEAARQKAGRFINAEHPGEEIIFTRNTTESINLVANAWGRKFLKPGDEIVFTAMEHHSNLIPWQMIAQATGATLRYIEIDDDGKLIWDDVLAKIGERTKIVAITQMSNVLGTISPIKEIAGIAHRYGAVVLVDGAQSVPHMPVDVRDLDCDFLAFSSHKMLGPTGVGVLYGKRDLLNAMDPYMGGGEMILRVTYGVKHRTRRCRTSSRRARRTSPASSPSARRSITSKASAWTRCARTRWRSRSTRSMRCRRSRESRSSGRRTREKGGAVAFNYGEVHPHDLSQVLDQQGIAIRAGHHCAQPLMRRLGCVATARASFYIYNREDEVDALVDGLGAADRIFGRATARA